jgi:hypothetical protein
VFELRRRDTGSLVHAYATEGAALAFVRDVIFIGGRDQRRPPLRPGRVQTTLAPPMPESSSVLK